MMSSWNTKDGKTFEKKSEGNDKILIILMWIAMTIIGWIACGVIEDPHLQPGNPLRLMNAIDYNGRICGYDPGVENKPYGYYLMDTSAVCVKTCPKVNNYEEFYCRYEDQDEADASTSQAYVYVGQRRSVDAAQAAAQSVASSYNSSAVVGSYEEGKSGSGWFSNFLGDVLRMDGYIFGFGIGVSTGIAFLYLYILRLPGLLFTLIWGVICSVFVFLIVGSFLLWDLANQWKDDGLHSKPEIATMQAFAYIGMACTALYFCLMVVMRKRIQLAIGIVKQACRALTSLSYLLLLPVLQTTLLTIFLVPWIIYVFYLASSGEVKVETQEVNGYTTSYRTFEYTTNTKYAFLYMIFAWFWTSEFILACGQLIIALCFTAWYFTRDKGQVGIFTIKWAFSVTWWYHMGSCAFGSLIIAIIKTIRAVIAYIQRKAKKSGNKVLEYIMCILQCFMWCLEKCMKFINKHAYILIAIYGYTFCKAARRAFFLLLRNILRVAAVNVIASFLLFIGKIFVPIATVFLCYLAMAYSLDPSQITGIIAPLVFTFLISYWVSSMFTEIFGMGIETILFCFIADEEMFKVEDRFAEGELMTTIQKTAQAAAAAKKVKIQVLNVKPKAEEAIAEQDAEKKKAADNNGPAVAQVHSPPGDLLL